MEHGRDNGCVRDLGPNVPDSPVRIATPISAEAVRRFVENWLGPRRNAWCRRLHGTSMRTVG